MSIISDSKCQGFRATAPACASVQHYGTSNQAKCSVSHPSPAPWQASSHPRCLCAPDAPCHSSSFSGNTDTMVPAWYSTNTMTDLPSASAPVAMRLKANLSQLHQAHKGVQTASVCSSFKCPPDLFDLFRWHSLTVLSAWVSSGLAFLSAYDDPHFLLPKKVREGLELLPGLFQLTS